MKKIITLLMMVLLGTNSFSQDLTPFFSKATIFLKTNVANGRVDYSKIHENQKMLDELMRLAESVIVLENEPKVYQAFWINAYNISVIKGIIDNYPTSSPLEITGFFDKETYQLAGKNTTLNDIENKLLREKFKDPRFHFVLVCGALGCPPLISEAYLPDSLDAQLEHQTKIALNGSFLKVNAKKKRVQASGIMKWYKEDFRMNGTSEIDFINKYRTEKIPSKYKLTYFPYDWSVNKQ